MSVHFSKRRVVFGAAVLCIVLFVVWIGVVSCLTAGVKLIVTNRMHAEIKNLEVKFTGGVVTAPIIKPGTAWQTIVQPSSESHLELRFTDASGRDRRETVGVYFERGYAGEILIDVAADGNLRLEDKTHLPGW